MASIGIPPCDVAVVGAGLKVRVLEARERVGGRAWSHQLEDGSWTDFGAQWIAPDQKRIQAVLPPRRGG